MVFSVKVEVFVEALRGDHLPFVDDLFWLVSIRRLLDNQQGPNWHNLTIVPPRNKRETIENTYFKIRKIQVILFEIDCAIFYTNLHELFCQFISWTNWVNSGKFMDNCWISCHVMADMKKVYNDLIIINLYESPFVALLLAVKHINLKSICLHYFPNRSCLSIFSFSMLFFLPLLTCLHTCFPAPPPL